MLDIFTKTVVKANDKFDNIGKTDLESIKKFIDTKDLRYDAINLISTNSSYITSDTISAMVNENPALIKAGGNCYPSSRMASCLRDVEIILRYITYAVAMADASILNERGLCGLKELYIALDVPLDSFIRAVEIMREKTIDVVMNDPKDSLNMIKGDCSSITLELATYFDIVIQNLS